MNKLLKQDLHSSLFIVLVTLTAPLLTIFVVPRLYSTEDLAEYTSSLYVVQVVAALSSLGVNTLLRRDCKTGNLSKNSAWSFSVYSNSFGAICAVFLFFISDASVELYLSLLSIVVISVCINIYRINNEFKSLTLIEPIYNNIIPIIAIFTGAFLSQDRFRDLAFMQFLLALILLIKGPKLSILKDIIKFRNFLYQNWRRVGIYFFQTISNVGLKKLDYFLLITILLPEEFKYYSYAYLLLNFSNIIFGRFMLIMEPYALKLSNKVLYPSIFLYSVLLYLGVQFLLPMILITINVEYLGYTRYVFYLWGLTTVSHFVDFTLLKFQLLRLDKFAFRYSVLLATVYGILLQFSSSLDYQKIMLSLIVMKILYMVYLLIYGYKSLLFNKLYKI